MARAKPDIDTLMRKLEYSFQDPGILTLALTHSSASDSPAQGKWADNERLEFLGDRVLGLVIADMLMEAYPRAPEGDLARRFNALVRKETCADVARELSLGDYLVLGMSEVRAGGHTKEAILADACEALLAAIYRDGGFTAANDFIRKRWRHRLDTMGDVPRDPKTLLQEWAQARALPHPIYVSTGRTGPDHAPVFTMEVQIKGLSPASGSGSSKRRAEQAAAQTLLEREKIL
ncbi:MAG TPA: ribonuclease III [Rhizobiales bacterium]|nr:ribonuclease III [Hyphomicrobiales bacterium]